MTTPDARARLVKRLNTLEIILSDGDYGEDVNWRVGRDAVRQAIALLLAPSLRPWVQHTTGCKSFVHMRYRCDCGLDTALKEQP